MSELFCSILPVIFVGNLVKKFMSVTLTFKGKDLESINSYPCCLRITLWYIADQRVNVSALLPYALFS